MRARHWRGWMRGSRTTSELRSAETFSAHLTERRYGGIWRLRCRKVCRILGRSTISIPSTTGHSLRAITTGRRTVTHRSSITDRLTGAKDPSEMWTPRATPVGTPRVAHQTETAWEKDVRKIQVIYPDYQRWHAFLFTVPQDKGVEQLCPGFNRRIRSVDHRPLCKQNVCWKKTPRGREQRGPLHMFESFDLSLKARLTM